MSRDPITAAAADGNTLSEFANRADVAVWHSPPTATKPPRFGPARLAEISNTQQSKVEAQLVSSPIPLAVHPICFIGVNRIDRVTSHRNRMRRSHDHLRLSVWGPHSNTGGP